MSVHVRDLYKPHMPKLRAAAFRDALQQILIGRAQPKVMAQFIQMAEDEGFRTCLKPDELAKVDERLPGIKQSLKIHDFGIG